MIAEVTRRDMSACCKVDGDATPEEIWNRPALSAIKYRVGTYSSFKRSMVGAISRDSNLKSWTARSSDDHGIAFLDMWAYLSDILENGGSPRIGSDAGTSAGLQAIPRCGCLC
jgi:hypothetical protein